MIEEILSKGRAVTGINANACRTLIGYVIGIRFAGISNIGANEMDGVLLRIEAHHKWNGGSLEYADMIRNQSKEESSMNKKKTLEINKDGKSGKSTQNILQPWVIL